MAEKLLIPVYLPRWLRDSVVKAKRFFIPPPPAYASNHYPVNIFGERNIEWAFLSSNMPTGPGAAIEFGCEHGYMSLVAAQNGFRVLAVDLEDQPFLWKHSNVEFRKGDFLSMELPRDSFDLAINCSSVEHVGVVGRYGIELDQPDGDIQVMDRLAEVLKPGGVLLMTAPCGRDAVMAPWCRVYGRERLPKVLSPFKILKQSYWVKNDANQWVGSDCEAALDFQCRYDPTDPHECLYALGGFVLRKANARTSDRN